MGDFFKILSGINIFDIIFLILMIYFIIQCFLKGFSLSFISFMKWIFALVVTIILVPKLQPWVNNYIESEFINNFGIGIAIFICTIFLTIVAGKSLSRAVTLTGVGSIDKTFGLLFGSFKGYVVSICLFSILGKWQAAAITGPAHGPRPTSSTPITNFPNLFSKLIFFR